MEKSQKSKNWQQVGSSRWQRIDGAIVKWDDSSPYPNPMNPRSRLYTAWEPDPSERALMMHRGRLRKDQKGHLYRFGFPRRWKTAEAAMKAVDKEFPLE
jgi:hypothetical protein